ncbi:hypothetical protein VTP01DRAFT_2122 [Rhizomucor pusillus]|uniref:uncharacterized protein n=1 Tax=Rhizomucor pusillus TaxID=4840 RepID=UPI00374445B1
MAILDSDRTILHHWTFALYLKKNTEIPNSFIDGFREKEVLTGLALELLRNWEGDNREDRFALRAQVKTVERREKEEHKSLEMLLPQCFPHCENGRICDDIHNRPPSLDHRVISKLFDCSSLLWKSGSTRYCCSQVARKAKWVRNVALQLKKLEWRMMQHVELSASERMARGPSPLIVSKQHKHQKNQLCIMLMDWIGELKKDVDYTISMYGRRSHLKPTHDHTRKSAAVISRPRRIPNTCGEQGYNERFQYKGQLEIHQRLYHPVSFESSAALKWEESNIYIIRRFVLSWRQQ